MFEFLTKIFYIGSLSVFKGFDEFSAISLKGKVGFLIERLLGVFHFPRDLVIVAKSFEKGFLTSFTLKYVFSNVVKLV